MTGTEIFGSYTKDWNNSYKVNKKVQEYENGKKIEKEKEYHKEIEVFARVVGERPGLIIGHETVTDKGRAGKQEYKPHVAIRLVKKLKEMYGRGIDVIVGDAIYLNKKFIEAVQEEGYEAVIRLKDNQRLMKEEVEGLYKLKEAEEIEKTKEKEIKCWSEIIEYQGIKLKVVKFKEKYKKRGEIKEDIIYVVSTDKKLKNSTINKIIHARWDIENEGFNELKNQCHMNHCYICEENAIQVILEMMIMSYNLWELYIYGHIHNFKEMKITKIGYIEKVAEAINEAKYKELIMFSSA